jgi:putative endonuclease
MARLNAASKRAAKPEKGSVGRRAEDAVARHLWWQGYQILERNYRTRSGEVDIIARQGDTIVFVEVRSKKEGSEVAPKDTVTRSKERRIDAVASAYLKARRLTDVSIRYDIAEVWTDERGRPARVELLEGAFGDPNHR